MARADGTGIRERNVLLRRSTHLRIDLSAFNAVGSRPFGRNYHQLSHINLK